MLSNFERIRSQLETLDGIVEWMDASQTQARDLRIAVAAIIFATVSIAGVIAELIGVFDMAQQLGVLSRIWIVVWGCSLCFLLAILLSAVAHRKM